jgi:hypothetical protein
MDQHDSKVLVAEALQRLGVPTTERQKGSTVAWKSLRQGRCTGRVILNSEPGWVLIEETRHGRLVWVREALLNMRA